MWAIEDHTVEWSRQLLVSDISESDALEHFHFRREHLQERLWMQFGKGLKEPWKEHEMH